MPVNRFTIDLMYVLIALPVILFGAARLGQHRRASKELLFPTISALLLLLAVIHDLKALLLGPDYTNRLYITIDANFLLAIVAAIYFSMRQKWTALIAAVVLAVDWAIMGAINSVI